MRAECDVMRCPPLCKTYYHWIDIYNMVTFLACLRGHSGSSSTMARIQTDMPQTKHCMQAANRNLWVLTVPGQRKQAKPDVVRASTISRQSWSRQMLKFLQTRHSNALMGVLETQTLGEPITHTHEIAQPVTNSQTQ